MAQLEDKLSGDADFYEGKITFLILVGAFWLLANLGFIGTTALKETEIFWRNRGGYPVPLRDFVRIFYYPLTILMLSFQSLTTVSFFFSFVKQRRREGLYGLLVMGPSWLLTLMGIGLLVANNVLNFLEGRPLHWHAP